MGASSPIFMEPFAAGVADGSLVVQLPDVEHFALGRSFRIARQTLHALIASRKADPGGR